MYNWTLITYWLQYIHQWHSLNWVEVKISLPSHGLENANCSAALVTYETQLMVMDDES